MDAGVCLWSDISKIYWGSDIPLEMVRYLFFKEIVKPSRMYDRSRWLVFHLDHKEV